MTTELLFPFAMGVALGLTYLACLWLSVRALIRRPRLVAWTVMGLITRVMAVTGALYLIMDGHVPSLLYGFTGFLLVRIAALHMIRSISRFGLD